MRDPIAESNSAIPLKIMSSVTAARLLQVIRRISSRMVITSAGARFVLRDQVNCHAPFFRILLSGDENCVPCSHAFFFRPTRNPSFCPINGVLQQLSSSGPADWLDQESWLTHAPGQGLAPVLGWP